MGNDRANQLLILATGYLIELRLLGRLNDSVVFADRVHARATTLSATQPMNKGGFAWFHLHRAITLTLLGDDPVPSPLTGRRGSTQPGPGLTSFRPRRRRTWLSRTLSEATAPGRKSGWAT